ncbi:MAG: hypothetical protein V1839_03590 [archaeon]
MERITKIIIALTIGIMTLIVLRIFYYIYYSNLFLPVFLVIMGYILYKEMLRHRQTRFYSKIIEHVIPWIIIISIALFFEGHGMNHSANDISFHLQGASESLKSLVYFYDEFLSHKLIYLGLFGLFLAGILLQISRPFSFKMHRDDEVALGICGVLYGLGLGASLLEGQSPYIGIFAAAIFIPALLLHHQKHTLKVVIRRYPLNYFLALTCITILVLFAIYHFCFGSFAEPSAIICAKGYLQACVY